MSKTNYEFLKVEQAWLTVSDQLQQRNNVLAKSIAHLERFPAETRMAGRLMMLRYHLKMSLRQLTQSARQIPRPAADTQQLQRQWQHVHELFFLLRQIDTELNEATARNPRLRQWVDSLDNRVYRSAFLHLN
ncbi:hypothetical protein GCM10027578_00320 [Spirosoma luteolum]